MRQLAQRLRFRRSFERGHRTPFTDDRRRRPRVGSGDRGRQLLEITFRARGMHGALALAMNARVVLALCLAGPVAHAATPGYGQRSQIGQLSRSLDARGKAAPKPTFVRRQPLLQKLAAFARPGASTKDDVQRIEHFLAETEARFGEPISTLEHPAMTDGRRMRAEKALALLRFGRRPSEVTETFLRTTAKVDGADIAPRDLFIQRWRPIGKPSGKVYVIAPGFLETGRNYYEQAQLLNRRGHDVLILDQQWAGYTADSRRGVVKGAIDRGFGIARDVADAAAYGNELLNKEYGAHPKKQLVLVGTSMGGGPGVLGALTMYDAGKLDLGKRADGTARTIPADREYILQGAFLGRTRTPINDALDLSGRIPGVRNVALPATGLPLLNDDPGTNVKIAAHAVEEDVRGRPQAFRAALADITTVREMVADGNVPKGRAHIIHSAKDHLANTNLMLDTAKAMQDHSAKLRVTILPGKDHVIEETPGEQRKILE